MIDRDYKAISLHYNANDNLFGSAEITKVHLTPPAALEFVLALEQGKPMGCINCKDCGHHQMHSHRCRRTTLFWPLASIGAARRCTVSTMSRVLAHAAGSTTVGEPSTARRFPLVCGGLPRVSAQ